MLRSATDIETSKFAKKPDLSSLKSNANKLNINKFKTTLVALSKLNNV